MTRRLNKPSLRPRTWTKILLDFLEYKLGDPRLSFCPFFVTWKCNLRCGYCPYVTDTGSELFSYALGVRDEMSTEEAKLAVDQLSELGVVWMSFTGGEPLFRRDLEEIVSHARKKGMITILDTNAALVTQSRSKSLGEVFDRVVVSLEGLEEKNDELRGRGSFRRTMRGVELLRKNTDCRIGINFVVNRLNYQEVEDTVNFLRGKVDSITFQPVHHASEFLLEKEAAYWVQEKLLELKRKYPAFILNTVSHLKLFGDHLAGGRRWLECDAFDLYVGLMPNGDLCGCYYPYVVGNVLERPMRELRELGRRRKEELLARCGGCTHSSFFNFSQVFRRSFPAGFLHALLS